MKTKEVYEEKIVPALTKPLSSSRASSLVFAVVTIQISNPLVLITAS